jgi:hypothetical protein
MALIQKTNPVGLDREIDDFQVYAYAKLGFSDWVSYPRVYSVLNRNERGLIPAHFDSGIDYTETFSDDRVNISSFFLRSSDVKRVDNGYKCDVSWIMQCDLPSLFPLIPHRADEELAALVCQASNDYAKDTVFQHQSTEYGINNVYREFDKTQVKLDDMSNRHVVRFNYTVLYRLKCQ